MRTNVSLLKTVLATGKMRRPNFFCCYNLDNIYLLDKTQLLILFKHIKSFANILAFLETWLFLSCTWEQTLPDKQTCTYIYML